MKKNATGWVEEFAEWAANLRWEDVPERVKKLTRLQLLNMIAAGCGSLLSNEHQFLKGLKKWGKSGPSTALGMGRVTPEAAVFSNSCLSIAHDWDDYLFMGHTGHSSIWVSTALGEAEDTSLENVLLAATVANEIAGRFGAAVVIGPHNGQMWAHIHQVAGACAALKILGGSSEHFYNAVLLSLYMPHFTLEGGFMASDAKKFTAALPAVDGMKIALLALKGFRGGDVLTGKRGFFETFSFLPLTEFLHGFGEEWVSATLSFKPYPGCAYQQAPLECLALIMKEMKNTGSEFNVNAVKEITVEGSILTAGMEKMSERCREDAVSPSVNLNFSVRLSASLMLLEGEPLTSSHLSRENVAARWNEIKKVAGAIKLRHSWDFTSKLLKGLLKYSQLPNAVRKKGLFKTISSLRKVRKRHEIFSPGTEFFSLLKSGQLFSLLKLLRGVSAEKEEQSHISELEFNFGARVLLKMKGGVMYEAQRIRHSGAAGDSDENITSTVSTKFLMLCGKVTSKDAAERILSKVLKEENVKIREITEPLSEI